METTKSILTRSGDMISVDITDESCMKWGVKSGTRILTPDGRATVQGVGFPPKPEIQSMPTPFGMAFILGSLLGGNTNLGSQMWFIEDSDNGRSAFNNKWIDAESFVSEGFVIIGTPEEEEAWIKKLEAEGKKEIKLLCGHFAIVDITDESCMKWGVKSGMRISSPQGIITVQGVGCHPGNTGSDIFCSVENKENKCGVWNEDWVNAETFPMNLRILGTPEEEEAWIKKLEAEGKKEILTALGGKIIVDITDESCMKWGVKSGTRILTPVGEATVQGVGCVPDSPEAGMQMWCLWDDYEGAAINSDWTDVESFASEGYLILN